MTITTTGGQALTLPDAFAGGFAVVLFYRGAWCPYCNAQLRAFERASQTLVDNGIRVAALSVDDKDTTAALVARHQLTFPVSGEWCRAFDIRAIRSRITTHALIDHACQRLLKRGMNACCCCHAFS
jgi:peroxiredoxin